jgi:hypothetical protein
MLDELPAFLFRARFSTRCRESPQDARTPLCKEGYSYRRRRRSESLRATALCPSSARVCHWPLQLGFVSKTYDNTVVMAISPSVGQSSHCSSVTSRKFGVPTWGPITNEAASGYNTVIRFNLCENRLRGSEAPSSKPTLRLGCRRRCRRRRLLAWDLKAQIYGCILCEICLTFQSFN